MSKFTKKKTANRSTPVIPSGISFANSFSGGFRLRWLILIAVITPMYLYLSTLDKQIQKQFEGKRWAIPARVYARPMELYAGMRLTPEQLTNELNAIGYQNKIEIAEAGQYQTQRNILTIKTREFRYGEEQFAPQLIKIRFEGEQVASVSDADSRKMALVRLEPKLIGKIYPTHNEDRILIKLENISPLLVKALVAVEDRQFMEHNGISVRGMLRASVVNMRAGEFVQGGSTITQQLIKNLYLTSERTLERKISEVLMAVLLEVHYSKEEILEAYLNEVYLGQDGSRAIHGLGTASWFYFNKPVSQLKLHETALLVGLIRAASYYNPRKHPERAKERRDLVLDLMVNQKMINEADAELAKQEPLGVSDDVRDSESPYPAFLELVRRQLQQDYHEEDLRSEGLQVFTTLDPLIQTSAERALLQGIQDLEKTGRARKLEGAMVVTRSEDGEVLAMVNGRNPRYEGFNRPLDAQRQIGSLVKPSIYLTALENTRAYSLSTQLSDTPYEWLDKASGRIWRPKNYDLRAHGEVALHYALANSFNLATVRLGMELGVQKVLDTIKRLGINRKLPSNPAILLGSLELTPFEVVQMYQTIASGGFRVPPRTIRNVVNQEGKVLNRYSLSIEQRFDSAPVFLLNYAMQLAVREGTGRRVSSQFPKELIFAGKTGTSNDLRDSWFAGFDSELLTVTWLGRDDNEPINLSGGTGAMYVWGEFMKSIQPQALPPVTPVRVQWRWVDFRTGQNSREGAKGAILAPFITDHTTNSVASSHIVTSE